MSKLIYESNAHIDVNCIDRKRTKTQDHIFERNVQFLSSRTYVRTCLHMVHEILLPRLTSFKMLLQPFSG